MTREEFEKKITELINQLEDVVETSLPNLPELEDSLNIDDYESSKAALLCDINNVHFNLPNLSDKYFN